MITLTKAHVHKYKSIEDSFPVEITDKITVLVGKNESGKSAFLEALHKSLPALPNAPRSKFDIIFDYPKKDYIKYRPKHQEKDYAKVVELTFRIEKELAEKINRSVFHGEKVVAASYEFTRTTNYGNNNTVGFRLDEAAALAALKKPMQSIEHVDEIWTGSKTLDEVLGKIAILKLAVDSTLGSFAAEWSARSPKADSGWGTLDYFLWSTYASPNIPHFLYFDDYSLLEGKINLDSLAQRKNANPPQLSQPDETALGLFELAGTDVEELRSEEGYETSKAKLEAISITITQEVSKFWKQNKELSVEFDIKADPQDKPPFNGGKNLYIRIKNPRHGVTVPFDQRSKGFIWFFSFMVWFSSVQNRVGTHKAVVLLLDEPGLNLHALAQSDFLSYIEELAGSHQIIYSTHSPFMVKSDQLENVRVVEDRAKEGTRVTGDLAGSSDESVFPLQAALGYTIAQNLFIAKKNVLVEGPADFLLLQHMIAVLEAEGKEGLKEGILVPVGGLDKLVTFVALLGANRLDLVVLHDRGSKPHQKLEDLVQQKLIHRKKVLNYAMFRTPDNLETDIEDLFLDGLYVEVFNATYAKELAGKLVALSDLPQHPRIVERINLWLSAKEIKLVNDGGFNHYRVAQAMLPKLVLQGVAKETIDTFEKLFKRLNSLLS